MTMDSVARGIKRDTNDSVGAEYSATTATARTVGSACNGPAGCNQWEGKRLAAKICAQDGHRSGLAA